MQKEYSKEELKSYSNTKNAFIFKKISANAIYPTKATKHSVGIDLSAFYNIVIPAGKCILVDIGLSVFIPDGYEMQIRPRSSLSLKGIIAVFGTIDSDYSGMPLGVMLLSHLKEDFHITGNTRIAQAVICKVHNNEIFDADLNSICISEKERVGGFGSTGV